MQLLISVPCAWFLVCVLSLAADPLRSPAEAPMKSTAPDAVELELVRLVNCERQKAGLKPLRSHSHLTQAAGSHALHMAGTKTLAHELDGKSVGDRLDHVGFRWSHCGENIACGQDTPAEAFRSWMNSPGHRANILGPDYTQIGIGVEGGEDQQNYWVMVLAK